LRFEMIRSQIQEAWYIVQYKLETGQAGVKGDQDIVLEKKRAG